MPFLTKLSIGYVANAFYSTLLPSAISERIPKFAGLRIPAQYCLNVTAD